VKKFLILFLFLASSVSAQTVLNPTKVIFIPSADHNATVDGVPLVARYELRHFLVGATSPVSVQDLGKPTPDAGNQCTVLFTALPISSTNKYFAKVAAIGPTGEGVSEASNNYFFVGPPAPGGKPGVSKRLSHVYLRNGLV